MPEDEMVLIELLEEMSVSRVLSSTNVELHYLKPGNYCLVEIDNPIMYRGPKWYALSSDLAIGAPREYLENPNRGILFESPKRTWFANPPEKHKPGHAFRKYRGRPVPQPKGKAQKPVQ